MSYVERSEKGRNAEALFEAHDPNAVKFKVHYPRIEEFRLALDKISPFHAHPAKMGIRHSPDYVRGRAFINVKAGYFAEYASTATLFEWAYRCEFHAVIVSIIEETVFMTSAWDVATKVKLEQGSPNGSGTPYYKIPVEICSPYDPSLFIAGERCFHCSYKK